MNKRRIGIALVVLGLVFLIYACSVKELLLIIAATGIVGPGATFILLAQKLSGRNIVAYCGIFLFLVALLSLFLSILIMSLGDDAARPLATRLLYHAAVIFIEGYLLSSQRFSLSPP